MKVLLIVGESGVGKSTFARYLKTNYNYHIVRSYTTRSRRNNENDDDHIFISKQMAKEMLDKRDVVAHTNINGEDYFTTIFDFRIGIPNVYIVDAKGVNDVKRNCPDWDIKVLKIKTNENNTPKERLDRDVIIPDDSQCDLIVERIVKHEYHLYRNTVEVSKYNWESVL